MADPSTLITGPSSADNNTVILWVVAVLLAFGALAIGYIVKRVADNETKCRERDDANKETVKKLDAKLDAKDEKIRSLYEGVIADTAKTAIQNTSAMEKVATAIDNLATIVQSQAHAHANHADEDSRTPGRKRAS